MMAGQLHCIKKKDRMIACREQGFYNYGENDMYCLVHAAEKQKGKSVFSHIQL